LGFITLVLFSKDKKITIQNKKGAEPFTLLGIIFLCAGIALSSTIKEPAFNIFLSLGFIYFILGISVRNRDKKEE